MHTEQHDWLEIAGALADIETAIHRLKRRCTDLAAVAADSEQVLHIVADIAQLTRAQLVGTSRTAERVRPRHVAMFIMRNDLEMSYPRIAEIMRRDHTTVMHGVARVDRELRYEDPSTCWLVNATRDRLNELNSTRARLNDRLNDLTAVA